MSPQAFLFQGTAMLSFLIFTLGSLFGYVLGAALAQMRFKMMPWKLMKWHESSLGYRMIPMKNASIKRGDKAYLAIPVDTDQIKPGDEIKMYDDDEQ